MRALGYPVENLRSKSWDEFAAPGAPELDFVITVCDKAAGEVCPFWPGQPITAHWGFPDPAAVEGTDDEKRAAFAQTLRQMRKRVQLFLSLPLEALDTLGHREEDARHRPATVAVEEQHHEPRFANLLPGSRCRGAPRTSRSSTAI